jgi:hypothetical protein
MALVKVVDSDASTFVAEKAKGIAAGLSKTVGREVACDRLIDLMNA